MTDRARVVLQDSKHAIAAHSDDLGGEKFRISWVAIVSLLRAVGHILEKVDARQSTALCQAIEEWWRNLKATRPEPAIFWAFIDDERNRTLKLYQYSVERRLVLPGPVIDGRQVTIMVDKANSRGGGISSSAGNTSSRMKDGRFEGMSDRDVAWQAYDWWNEQLARIDARAAALAALP